MKTSLRWLLIFGCCALAGSSAWAARSRPARTPTPAAEPRRFANPLLPDQVSIAGLFPEMTSQQKAPSAGVPGFSPLYTAEDWEVYRSRFGAEADGLVRKKSSAYAELAGKFIATAEESSDRPGLQRLLLVRAVALCYRNRDGYTQAGKALAAYQRCADLSVPAQVAALFTLSDTLSRYSTTPRPERIKCSAIAAKANMQLALQLVELGQLDAARSLIKKITYHEGYVRSDAHLRARIAQVRGLVNSTGTMMEYLYDQYQAVVTKNDEAAALRLYLYARFVRHTPTIIGELHQRSSATAIQSLASALAQADRDAAQAFAAGDLLRNVAAELPDGVIKSRTLYAAQRYYRAFLHEPSTETQRVKRTLAQMAVQAVAADGARPAPTIRPFEEPPAATQPQGTPERPLG